MLFCDQTVICPWFTHYYQRRISSLRVSSNSEANASELLETLEDIFLCSTCKVICAAIQIFKHTIMCHSARKCHNSWWVGSEHKKIPGRFLYGTIELGTVRVVSCEMVSPTMWHGLFYMVRIYVKKLRYNI